MTSKLPESPHNDKTCDKTIIEDSTIDLLGGKLMKILDSHNLLNDRSKIASTPLSMLLHWKISLDVIVECRTEGSAPFETAWNLFQHHPKNFQKVNFNVEALDELTKGGIDVGSVTEIFGEAGSGKSQLCMQLALNVQLPEELNGLNGSALYISTDRHLPVKRLLSLSAGLVEKFSHVPAVHQIRFLDNVFVAEFFTVERLKFTIFELIPEFLKKNPQTRLIVIDSIAGIFRTETDYLKRAKDMREVVHELERLAGIYHFAVVATNQVTSLPQEIGSEQQISALGPTWDSLVVTKLKIVKTNKLITSKSGEICCERRMEVIYSPRLVRGEANFIVTKSGVDEAGGRQTQTHKK